MVLIVSCAFLLRMMFEMKIAEHPYFTENSSAWQIYG
jgi:hypothetical protein